MFGSRIRGVKTAEVAVPVRNVGGVMVGEPVVMVPGWWVVVRSLFRLVVGLVVLIIRAAVRYPLPSAVLVGFGSLWAWLGRDQALMVSGGLVLVVGLAAGGLFWWRRDWFDRLAWYPLVGAFRVRWVYRRHWRSAMATTRLGVMFNEQEFTPRIRSLRCDRYADRLTVDMVSGQAPEHWEAVVDALAHTFGALSCRVSVVRPRRLLLVFLRRDPLEAVVQAVPLPGEGSPTPAGADLQGLLSALPLGVTEDRGAWLLRLLGTHVLIAGASNAGKGSVVWSLLRALAPAIRAGLVAPWVIDPKGGMELSLGEAMFARFEADSAVAMAELLEEAVAEMDRRTKALRGVARQHTPTVSEPLILVVVDEVANLTAYLTDSQLRKRIGQALSLLLSKGRAVSVHVVAALQDPRKDVLPFRDLFPTRVALRLTEATQVDMVLGDGARDRGALCDQIPATCPGIGFVVLDGVREPVRVRASYVTDPDIAAMAAEFGSPHRLARFMGSVPVIPSQRGASE